MQILKLCLKILFITTSLLGLCSTLWASQLTSEKIYKISSRKTSVFLNSGIVFTPGEGGRGQVDSVRHSYSSEKGRERIVFDLGTESLPKIYGFISQKERKLYIDIFQTVLNTDISFLGKSHFIKNLNFFPIGNESLSLEIELHNDGMFDIFYLRNPGRLVIDVKS